MNRNTPVVVLVLLAALAPVVLAANQTAPAGSVYKQIVLMLSLAAFGLILGQYWLSRLLPKSVANPAVVLRWHKVVGYAAGGFLLIHPVLMIARRFWVQETDPVDNLLLMLRAPALLPAIGAWAILAVLVVLSLVRGRFRPKGWRMLHGVFSVGFAGMATWHVVAVGRHSTTAMSVYWIVVAAAAVGMLLSSYRSALSMKTGRVKQGVAHELAR